MQDMLKKIVAGDELSFFEIRNIVRKIVKKEVSEAQIGAFLISVTQKGVSADELFGFASAMREFSNRVPIDKYLVDSCGTGVDSSRNINISTASAIVASSCGVNVLKQTNSSVTGACGSTDLLEALSVDIARIPQDAKSQFEKHNIAFLHSPYFNEFARINSPIKQQLGIKTIFNYLVPLINPSFPNAQLLGVSSLEMCEKMIYALQKLQTDRALVVNGLNPNIDEISICSKTAIYELKDGKITDYMLDPEDFGFSKVDVRELKGGNKSDNAQFIIEILKGEIVGAKRNVIALNAGAMIYLAGITPDIFGGVKLALDSIKDGLAYDKLLKLQKITPTGSAESLGQGGEIHTRG